MRRLYHDRQTIQEFKMNIVLELQDLEPAQRSRLIEELTSRSFHHPFSKKRSLSCSVIYQWLKDAQETLHHGKALLPKERSDRDTFRRLSLEQQSALKLWRSENPYRSAAQLRQELMDHPQTNHPAIPSESTIVRYLRSLNLDRKTLLQKGTVQGKIRLSYQSPYPQWLWLADTKGPNLYVVDPEHPDQTKLAKPIVFLDDSSRFVVAACYVFEDNERLVMHLFRGAIATYGTPNNLYVDRGSPYMGHSLQRAATLLGCKLIHTRPRDAPAKGKAERIMRSLYEQLESELVLKQPPLTLDEANEYLNALISQDYHKSVHSSTDQPPEEMFFQLPPKYRRFVSQDVLALIFLPCTRSKVSKTGLIHLNKHEYLVPEVTLYKQWVEVRFNPLDARLVYVWWKDRYYGEAHVYVADNDFAKRQQHLERLQTFDPKPESLSSAVYVPPYSRLERKLAEYRQEVAELELNHALKQTLAKKEQVKAELTPVIVTPTSPHLDDHHMVGAEFSLDRATHLLSVLFKRSLDARERLALATVWHHYGPFQEAVVRLTVGRLLGEGHPVSDLMGYLDALRLTAGK